MHLGSELCKSSFYHKIGKNQQFSHHLPDFSFMQKQSFPDTHIGLYQDLVTSMEIDIGPLSWLLAYIFPNNA